MSHTHRWWPWSTFSSLYAPSPSPFRLTFGALVDEGVDQILIVVSAEQVARFLRQTGSFAARTRSEMGGGQGYVLGIG